MRVGLTRLQNAADTASLGNGWSVVSMGGKNACLHVSRTGIKVESPFGMSVSNLHCMKYEREEGQDYTFLVGYSASDGGGTTFNSISSGFATYSTPILTI